MSYETKIQLMRAPDYIKTKAYDKLKELNMIIDNNYWYEQVIVSYYIATTLTDITNAQYNYWLK